MKMKKVENNEENNINIGSTWSSTPTINFEKEGVGVDDHIDPIKNGEYNVGAGLVSAQKGITLIALIITIIIMLILAGVVISLTIGENGIFNTAKYAVSETKKKQVQEEIQLAVTDIITKYLSGETELTNTVLKGELEKYNSLQGITVDEDLVGTYKNYNYYIDETYTVHIGEKTQEKPFDVNIEIKEEDRKIIVSVTDPKEPIQTIELIAPNGKVIEIQKNGETEELGKINSVANLSGLYKVKVTSENGGVAIKTIAVKKIEITNKEELVKFGEMVNSGVTFEGDTVTLLADIDLGGSASNRNWNSMGSSLNNTGFSGTFEGNNHKIFNICNTQTSEPQKGFFGYIDGGTVQNLGIESGHIVSDRNTGGITGRINNGSIINCYNKAKIEGGNTTLWAGYSGGIVGSANESIIQNCYNEGEVIGNCDSNGGIVGLIANGTQILSCYNIGKLTGTMESNGGIVGGTASVNSTGKTNIVDNCYNKGDITGGNRVGGIFGRIMQNDTEVKNSYSTGKITAINASNPMAGGVIGEHNGILSNLFFINTAGPAYGCGLNNTEYFLEESEGSTEATLKGLTDKLNGEQNPKPWKADEDNINEGYPILSWQKLPNANEEE